VFFLCSGVLIASLCAKQWKIWRLFSNKSLTYMNISNMFILCVISLLNIPVLILLVLWTAADNLGANLDSKGEHLICTSDNYWVFLGLLIGYQGFLLVLSSLLALMTRHYGKYGESKLIGFAVYNATLMAAAILPIIFSIDTQYFLQWLIGVLYLEFYFFSTFTILLLSKVYQVIIVDWGKPIEELKKLPSTQKLSNTSSIAISSPQKKSVKNSSKKSSSVSN